MVGDLPTFIQQKFEISLQCGPLYGAYGICSRDQRGFRLASQPRCFACQVSKHTERETSGLSVERLAIIHWGKRGHHVMSFPHCHPGTMKTTNPFRDPAKTAGCGKRDSNRLPQYALTWDDLRNQWRPVPPGITGWWYTYHLEKYESQWEGLSHI